MPCEVSLSNGSRPIATVRFRRNSTGAVEDPTAVLFTWRDPLGVDQAFTEAAPEVENPSVGVWVCTFPAAAVEPGTWHVRAEGTAGLIAAAEASFVIDGSVFV